MPSYIARRIQDQLNLDGKPLRGSLVILLGVTYKPNIADTRESPAIPLAKTLLQQGATLWFHDPLVKQLSVAGRRRTTGRRCRSIARCGRYLCAAAEPQRV